MEPPSTGNVTVLNQSTRRVRISKIRQAAEIALACHGHATDTVCLLLTDDQHIRELNRQFRKVDEATDVLTFPSPGGGDIAISVEYAERQAEARNVSLTQELGYLAIHGALHLAGFDDESESEREAMVRQMNLVAIEAGLKPDEEWWSLLHGEAA
ncbi:MAG: rRNA maturation RNase YbeY [Fimbriimonas sp.]